MHRKARSRSVPAIFKRRLAAPCRKMLTSCPQQGASVQAAVPKHLVTRTQPRGKKRFRKRPQNQVQKTTPKMGPRLITLLRAAPKSGPENDPQNGAANSLHSGASGRENGASERARCGLMSDRPAIPCWLRPAVVLASAGDSLTTESRAPPTARSANPLWSTTARTHWIRYCLEAFQ